MNRIMTNQSWWEIHPVNPAHPVEGFGVNEIIGKFGGADQFGTAATVSTRAGFFNSRFLVQGNLH